MQNDRDEAAGMKALRRHPVAAFLLLAFAISWGGILVVCLPSGIPGRGAALESLFGPVFLFMLAGPFVAGTAMAFALDGRGGLAALFGGFTRWRVGAVDMLLATCLIPACALAVLLPLSLSSEAYVPGFLGGDGGVTMIALFLAGGLMVALIEETGWTGFATPRMLERRGVLAVAVLLGVVHGVWHFLSNIWAEGAEFGPVFIPYFLTAWILAVVNMRILAVRLYKRTGGSTLIGAVVHASHTGGLLAIWPPATSPVQDLIWTSLFGVLGLVAVLAVTRTAHPS